MIQSGAKIRGPSTGVAGGSIDVEVLGNADSIQVAFGGANNTKTFDVPAGGTVSVPIPPGVTGFIFISIGEGLNRRGITVEIVSPGP